MAVGLLSRARDYVRPRPFAVLETAVVIAVTSWVLVTPFLVVKYPPINDLPMQASITSIFRHWFDPTWHFREQFDFQILEVPLLTNYVLGALFALVMPISWAVKLSSLVLMASLPIGLAIYCHGLKKTPLWGAAAAGLAWGSLTQWGFLSFVGALGLTLAGLGVTLLLLERPTRRRAVMLGAIALLLLVTHITRFPFFCLAVGITTVCLWPASRSLKPVVVPLLPAAVLFVIWWFIRPNTLKAPVELGWHPERAGEVVKSAFSFGGEEEYAVFRHMWMILLGICVYSLIVKGGTAWREGIRRPRITLRQACLFSGPLLVTLAFAVLYFSLPMKIGVWWFVYPRELTAAVLCGLALLPNLPVNRWLRLPALGALLIGIALPVPGVTQRYAEFEKGTQDFQRIIQQLPATPKLGYMVWGNTDFAWHARPLIHLPAWVQAERGGWLSFHFATWDASPVRFRAEEPRDVPPDTPDRFEWQPDAFDIATRGRYFDWFLVHSHESREKKFAVDTTLHLVDHQGNWWLYKRE